jgi:SOS response regulatory protein OraA/RecX
MLVEYGYIDDMGFARWWVEQRLGKRGFRGLKRELCGKGICHDIIDEVFDELGFGIEYHAAMKLLKKELTRSRGAYNIQRLASALNRRGFSCEVINRVCHSIRDDKKDWIETPEF